MVGDTSDEFSTAFWIVVAVWQLVIVPILFLLVMNSDNPEAYNVDMGDFFAPPKRGKSGFGGRRSGWRIKKYDPEGWKKKNGDKIFY
jgi:hypothetical protein